MHRVMGLTKCNYENDIYIFPLDDMAKFQVYYFFVQREEMGMKQSVSITKNGNLHITMQLPACFYLIVFIMLLRSSLFT